MTTLPHSLIQVIAQELRISAQHINRVLMLLEDGASIPFIARYRKEMTGSLDEVQLAQIRDRAEQLGKLEQRRAAILSSLQERDLLSTELEQAVKMALNLSELEDVYLPYRPKRRTRASIAKEQGLEPLADQLWQQEDGVQPRAKARGFINAAKKLADIDAALQGARDIMAERISEDAVARQALREVFERRGNIVSQVVKGKEAEGQKYRDYFAWQEPLRKIPSHRLLALLRAEEEKVLKLSLRPEDDIAIYRLEKRFLKAKNPSAEQVKLAVQDAYKRLLAPSMESETRKAAKERADAEAINVFVDNLRQLLLAAPLGQKRLLALDPGFRSGCKVVCLDEQGALLEHAVIHPHPPQKQTEAAQVILESLIKKHRIEVIAVGNGTASRETERFVNSLKLSQAVLMVNESGASVYSASDVAREEFPEHDVTVRGAVSIGRRLMDPLAELVKIDAKSIGVGQYQHDVDQGLLKKSLDDTVESCVNAVGVDVNTASKHLLTYVSGLGPRLAQNIVDYRGANGTFKSRAALKKVPRLGAKAFEQAAGFLRIRNGKHPLDGSAVHPERYKLVETMAADLNVDVVTLMTNQALRKGIKLEAYTSPDVGLPTLLDIMQELEKPGRDPREAFEAFAFAENIHKAEDLQVGMTLPGIITNITDFGVFVDVGVHQDGLVHISELAHRFVQHPRDVVQVQQKVMVRVLKVELERKRIALSMKL